MDLHLKNLHKLDPLLVPLPHGTEVTTRVTRSLADGRRVPEGAVGRVVGSEGDALDVNIVGVGVVRYLRPELVPRKIGQVRWAEERAAAWDALAGAVVIETTVGSRAWGLANEGSDTDLRGVFVLPFSWTTGLIEPPRDRVSADGSATYWEAGKCVRQALRADPNTLEALFVPSARARDVMGEWLLDARDAFVSREIYGSFGRYALSQLKRLSQSQRLAQNRSFALDHLREDPAPSLDALAEHLAAKSPRAAPTKRDALLAAKEHIKELYRSLYDQGLLEQRDYASLVRFARGGGRDVELPRELRPKNAYNLLRLIATATDWLRKGHVRFEVEGALKERLLAIKRGEVPLDDVLREAEERSMDLDDAWRSSPLPERADVAKADAVLRRINEEAARRWASGEPGAWGRDAPSPPKVAWVNEGGEP